MIERAYSEQLRGSKLETSGRACCDKLRGPIVNDLEGLLWTIEKACCERLRVPTVHNLLFRVPILNNLKGLLNLTIKGLRE